MGVIYHLLAAHTSTHNETIFNSLSFFLMRSFSTKVRFELIKITTRKTNGTIFSNNFSAFPRICACLILTCNWTNWTVSARANAVSSATTTKKRKTERKIRRYHVQKQYVFIVSLNVVCSFLHLEWYHTHSPYLDRPPWVSDLLASVYVFLRKTVKY